jgi:hypothetical protein
VSGSAMGGLGVPDGRLRRQRHGLGCSTWNGGCRPTLAKVGGTCGEVDRRCIPMKPGFGGNPILNPPRWDKDPCA